LAAEFDEMGYAMAIWPVSGLRIAARAMEKFYDELALTGTAEGAVDQMQTRAELYDVIRYFGYEALDSKIQRTVLPE
jgi:methylisocitrate lyase